MPTNAIATAEPLPRKGGGRRRATRPDRRCSPTGQPSWASTTPRCRPYRHRPGKADRRRHGRGIATVVIALGSRSHGWHRSRTGQRRRPAAANMAAVDAVYRTYTPDYVMLLGSIERSRISRCATRSTTASTTSIVLPTATCLSCNAPYSDDPTDFIGPDRVVGRLADVTGASTPAVLVKLLGRAVSWSSRPRSDYEAHLGITANVWQRSTVLSLRKLFAAAEVHSSPGEGPGWERALCARRVHFINCHAPSLSRGSSVRRATTTPSRTSRWRSCQPWDHRRRRVLYGCELWAPTDDVLSMPMAYLANGAAGYWGASTSPTGPPTPTAMPTSCAPTSSPPCSTARGLAGPRWRRVSGSSAARPRCHR